MANIPPEDAELELLLTRLLRMVSPSVTADGSARAHPSGAASAGDGNASTAEPVMPARADDNLTWPPVSASEARALIELASARGIAQGELANVLHLDKSTVSRLAAGLERKGWLRRGRDEDNQRYVRLYLTPQGAEVAARVWHAWQSRQARIVAGLSADERAGLTAGLRGLIRGLAAEGLLGEQAAPRS
ncbi:MAG TPA: MarR family transcriptional regulator [Streptosporangiaceae bacterium]|nr:MarR family transcriptional regulator [Streptosporangiaceae bacterium]